MGYPIYSNIFSDDPQESEHLRRFPIQVAVLYSPADKPFVDAFRAVFLELDQITGDDLVFFAVLDPPEEWLRVARNRPAWREYWERRTLGHTMDDRVLIDEIAHQFGIQWSDLPAIVVSTNLWSAEFTTTRTSPDHIVSQLRSLTELARKRRNDGDLDLGYILQSLQDKFGFPARYQPPDERLRRGFSRFYDVLSTSFEVGNDQSRRLNQYWNDIFFSTVRSARAVARRLREPLAVADSQNFAGVDILLRELAGRLVPFAAREEKIRNIRTPFTRREGVDVIHFDDLIAGLRQRNELLDRLDDETLTMIDRAIRVARFLDDPNTLEPILQPGPDRRRLEEYAPAAQGLWKAFEREVNKSVVQAMRSARTIEMPQFFARYRPQFRGRNYIETPKKIDINRQDWEDPLGVGHRFLEMGVALRCADALQGKPTEQFDQVVGRCLGVPCLPAGLLADWESIAKRRNPASHTELLSREGFQEVAGKALKPENLVVLMRIKQTLSK